MALTKSEYMMFLKHPAWLWLKKHAKEKLPGIDANTQAMFDAGHKLEPYAEKLFPGGITLGFNSYSEYQTLSGRTEAAINAGNTVLFQARFDAAGLICLTDIIEFTASKTLNLYEIKSSTKVKPEHEYDLAFQAHVLEEAGYHVENISVIYINNAYVRSGDIDPSKLLITEDVTSKVRSLHKYTISHIEQALYVANSLEMPDISPRYCHLGSMSEWLKIYRSLTEIPEMSIYDLAYPSAALIGALEDQDIKLIKDITDEFTLTETQKRQVEAVRSGKHSVNKEKIKAFLDRLVYPLYFLDYETCADVIPPYDSTRPYQQIPCQYSLHILESPGGDLRHTEYIHRTPDHPAKSLAAALRRDVGRMGSFIVWSATFEMSCNRLIADMVPEYAAFFTDINSRVADLMKPFSEGMYTDPAFMGSASIKKVLPVLVPELSYKDLEVQEGQTAQRLWMDTVLNGVGTDTEKDRLFQNLLTYCELDTMAMVRIYEKLASLVELDVGPVQGRLL